MGTCQTPELPLFQNRCHEVSSNRALKPLMSRIYRQVLAETLILPELCRHPRRYLLLKDHR